MATITTFLVSRFLAAGAPTFPTPSASGSGTSFYGTPIGQMLVYVFGDFIAPVLVLVGILMFLKGFFGEKKMAKGLKSLVACLVGAGFCLALAGGTGLLVTAGQTIFNTIVNSISSL